MSPELERMYQQWVTDGRPGNKPPRSLLAQLMLDQNQRKARDEQQRTQPHARNDAGLARDGS